MTKRKHIAFASIAIVGTAIVPVLAWLIFVGLESLGVHGFAAMLASVIFGAFACVACAGVAGVSLAELFEM